MSNQIKRAPIVLCLILIFPLFGQAAQSQSSSDERKVLHVLNRLTYGPRPGDIEAVQRHGIEAFIHSQLHPEALQESQEVRSFISSVPALNLTPAELFKRYGPPAVKERTTQLQIGQDQNQKKLQSKVRQTMFKTVYQDVTKARILRAVASPKQLQELMTDFWFNHFNVFANKGLDHIWIGSYEEQAIRPHALGKFRDLLEATCYHSAMLFYLDNWRNKSQGAGVSSKENGSNENYARELMELHTLGVDGGYTQKDVTELARILTGLGLPNAGRRGGRFAQTQEVGNEKFGYQFDQRRHDYGDKVLLGHVIKGSGSDEIDQALTILATSPATAHHISYQLAQYFVADSPPPSLVDKLASTFSQTDGDIRSVLNVLFHSPEFWNKSNENSKYKTPYRYLVSTFRALDTSPGNYERLNGFLRQQGMPLYGCLTPDGFKNTTEAWLNPDMLLKRINFATALTLRRMPRVYSGSPNSRQLIATLGNDFTPRTMLAINKAPEPMKPALMLGSPEFMKY